ncbi:unnamed protein product, partial [Meganyctiphanes norvegica]
PERTPKMVTKSILPMVLAVVMLLNGVVFATSPFLPAAGGRMIRVRKDVYSPVEKAAKKCGSSIDCGPEECCVQPYFGSTTKFCSPMKGYGHQCSARLEMFMGGTGISIGECPCQPGLACKKLTRISFCVPYMQKRFIQNLHHQQG